MLTKLFPAIALLCISASVHAQSFSPYAFVTCGNYQKSNAYTLSYTIGQLVTTTLTKGNDVLAQGFQSPGQTATTGLEDHVPYDEFIAYPNPFKATFNLLNLQKRPIKDIHLMSIQGQRIPAYIYTVNNQYQIIPYAYMPSGTYLLNIIYAEGYKNIMLTKIN